MSTKNQRPPKILPWLARKADIPIELAESLWLDASTEAAHRWVIGSSEYYKDAIDRLLAKMAAEALTRRGTQFGFAMWLRLPVRLWLYGIDCGEALALAATRRWPGAHC